MKQLPKPKGRQGSWFARTEDRDLPCVHDHWEKALKYRDPNVDGRRQWVKFLAALRSGQPVILTQSRITEGGAKWRRSRYLSLWRIANVQVTDGVLTFDFVDKLAEFRND